jgi:hypothetical protein
VSEIVRDGPRHQMRTVGARRDPSNGGGVRAGRCRNRERSSNDREATQALRKSHATRSPLFAGGSQRQRPARTLSRTTATSDFEPSDGRTDDGRAVVPDRAGRVGRSPHPPGAPYDAIILSCLRGSIEVRPKRLVCGQPTRAALAAGACCSQLWSSPRARAVPVLTHRRARPPRQVLCQHRTSLLQRSRRNTASAS